MSVCPSLWLLCYRENIFFKPLCKINILVNIPFTNKYIFVRSSVGYSLLLMRKLRFSWLLSNIVVNIPLTCNVQLLFKKISFFCSFSLLRIKKLYECSPPYYLLVWSLIDLSLIKSKTFSKCSNMFIKGFKIKTWRDRKVYDTLNYMKQY